MKRLLYHLPFPIFSLISLLVLLTSCDTVLQYPEDSGVDPSRPNGTLTLTLHYNRAFNLLGEFEYDFENPYVLISPRSHNSSTDAYLHRYTVKAFSVNDHSSNPVALFEQTVTTGIVDVTEESFDIELLPGDYRIIVWADYVPAVNTNSQLYDASNFSEIILKDDNGHPGSNLYRDAFYGETKVTVNKSTEEKAKAYIELDRPLARYTFISNDLRMFFDKEQSPRRETAKSDESVLDDYTVRIVYTQYMPCSFNAFSGKPCDSRLGVEYRSKILMLDDDRAQLAFDYVFTNGTQTAIAVAMEVIHLDGTVVARVPQFDVPLRRTSQTYVVGKFLTTKSGGDIGINTEFDGEFNIVIK